MKQKACDPAGGSPPASHLGTKRDGGGKFCRAGAALSFVPFL